MILNRKTMFHKMNKFLKFSNSLSKFKEYSKLPEMNIKVIDEAHQCKKVIEDLRSDCTTYNLLGFDCEWCTVESRRQRVALLQLATHTGLCALIRLNCVRPMPAELKALLRDERILKVGIQPIIDGLFLTQDYNIAVQGTLDLRFLAVLSNCEPRGLEKMSKQHLNIDLNKKKSHQLSDWEAKTLSDKQINYAAIDALIGIELFKVFASRLKTRHFWANEAIFVQNVIADHCKPYVDEMFKDNFVR